MYLGTAAPWLVEIRASANKTATPKNKSELEVGALQTRQRWECPNRPWDNKKRISSGKLHRLMRVALGNLSTE